MLHLGGISTDRLDQAVLQAPLGGFTLTHPCATSVALPRFAPATGKISLRREDIGTTVDIIWTPALFARSAVSKHFLVYGLDFHWCCGDWKRKIKSWKSSEIWSGHVKDRTPACCEGQAVVPATAWVTGGNGGVKKFRPVSGFFSLEVYTSSLLPPKQHFCLSNPCKQQNEEAFKKHRT